MFYVNDILSVKNILLKKDATKSHSPDTPQTHPAELRKSHQE